YVHQHEFSYFLRALFFILKATANCIERESPKALVACRNTSSGDCATAVASAKGLGNAVLLDAKTEKRFKMFPNLTKEKALEIRRKLPKVLASLVARQTGDGKKTVFIRSRGYLDSLKGRMQKDSEFNVISLDEFLLKKMLNPLSLHRYFSTRAGTRKKFRQAFGSYSAGNAFREKTVFEGMNFGRLLQPLMQQAAERDWPEFVFLIGMLAGFFRSQKPAAVVLWDDMVAFERICALLAKQFGIPSLVVQHGLFHGVPARGNWIRGFAPLTADRIAVWGKIFKKSLVDHGVQPSRIVITGCPRFDALLRKKLNATRLRQEYGICPGEKAVLFITQVSLNQPDVKRILAGLALGNKTKKTRFIVKLHPMDYSRVDEELAGMAIVVKDRDFYELLNVSDAVITESSTGGLEAMVLGKPAIVFRQRLPLETFGFFKFYDSADAVFKASDLKGLEKALGTALNKRRERMVMAGIKKFVYAAAFKQDGKATERVLRLVKNTVGNDSGPHPNASQRVQLL
ncbi:MAG: UDP-N-acetylglucosamine 2-epimerase, partial [Candidatus Diapherotrites archaeon]|nr:UDP-N-acetylglucosamine 2-epimerase [Candidatus Diapherotrites archaeon]